MKLEKKVFELKDMDSGKQTTYSLSKLINLLIWLHFLGVKVGLE